MKKILLVLHCLCCNYIILYATDITFKITLDIKGIGSQEIKLGDMFTLFDSVQSNNNIIELHGKMNHPDVVQISFSNGGFILVFVDTNKVFISGKYPISKFYDYNLCSTSDSKRYQVFMKEYNHLSLEKKKYESLNSPSNMLDSLENSISNCILENLQFSNSKYLSSYLLTSARFISKKEFMRTCFEILKNKYIRIEDFKSDFPIYKDLISEIYMSTLDRIDTSFNFYTIDSVLINLAKYEKKYILLDFWADWCIPCIQSIPTISTISNNQNSKTAIISIALHSNLNKVKALVKDKKMNWDIIVITDKEAEKLVYSAFKINLLPTYFLCTPKGDIILRKYGEEGLKEINAYIENNK